MPDLISRRFDELTTSRFHDLAKLRSDVFVVEQDCAYPDLDGRDVEPTTEHHWIEVDSEVACCARTLLDPGGETRIGRVATAAGARGHGLASALMTALVARFGDGPLLLEAQSHLADWYAGFGFEVTGEEYLDDGIPHVPMRRNSDEVR